MANDASGTDDVRVAVDEDGALLRYHLTPSRARGVSGQQEIFDRDPVWLSSTPRRLAEAAPVDRSHRDEERRGPGCSRWGGELDDRGVFFFFSSRRRHTRLTCDWSSDVCSSD